MTEFLVTGLVLGLSAGITPGPLFTLVVAETLRHGTRAGMKAALAPLITDLPIVALALFLLSRLARQGYLLGAISIAGGLFLFTLGWENLRAKAREVPGDMAPPRSLEKAVAVNALSPHPYLFWMSVGGPIAWRAYESGVLPATVFVGSFYFLMVGSKILLAAAAGRSRQVLRGRGYLTVMRLLGISLFLLALMLIREGFNLILSS